MTAPADVAPRGYERGIAAIWTALMITILVAAAGMATDVGNWNLNASREQKAADAAALGGVVFLPADLSTARDVAFDIAAQHGYDGGEVNVEQGEQANQLRVTISRSVPTTFLSVVGVDARTITQTALAEFEAPVDMGSPEPEAGNDPEGSPPNEPQYWLNSAGPRANKINGDRYATQPCGGATYNCSGDTNDDYDSDGYFFGVDVPASMAGRTLSVQVFDGVMYHVGDRCNSSQLPEAGDELLDQLVALTDGSVTRPTGLPDGWYDDADERYARDGSIWCTGDQNLNGSDVRTTFVFRAPDETPWSNLDNPVVAECPAVTMPAVDQNLSAFDLLFPEGTELPLSAGDDDDDPSGYTESNSATHGQHVIDPDDGHITFGETFRRWYTMCEIPGGSVQAGEYLVQMITNSGGGHNRLSVRAGSVTDSGFAGHGVSVAAKGRLPIAALARDSNTLFSIARVLPGGRNRELQIELFDMGDANNPGTLRILPPADANRSSFSGCSFVRSDGAALAGAEPSTCSLAGVHGSQGFNGRAIVARVPIPTDYDCDATSTSGCWVRVQAIFAGPVADTTTWSAVMNGDPVRLIQ